MQVPAQISGQVSGQVAGQLVGVPQQNMNSLPLQGVWRRTWQTDLDVGIRRTILEKILNLFRQKGKLRVTQDWQQKLPDLVKRLEESLYRGASSKEEYADLSTLEHRLQAVAKRIAPPRSNPNSAACGVNASASMIPTPGMPSVLNGSIMIPTPGNEINVVPTSGAGTTNMKPNAMGDMLNSSSPLLQAHGMASGVGVGNMVPTPGLASHAFTSVESTTAMPGNSINTPEIRAPTSLGQNVQLAYNVGDQMIPSPNLNSSHVGSNANSAPSMPNFNDTAAVAQMQRQQYNSGSCGQVYRNMNGQSGGSVANNIHQKNSSFGFANGDTSNRMQLIGSGQNIVKGNSGYSDSLMYTNSAQFGNVSLHSQQNISQQRQKHISMQSTLQRQVPGHGYAMNTADLAGAGNFYSPVSVGLSTSSLGMHSQGLQLSKMIPVPGLPSQQSNLQSQQQPQKLQSQVPDKYQQMNRQQDTSGIAKSHQNQLPGTKSLFQAQGSPRVYGQKQAGMALPEEETQAVPGSGTSLTSLFQSSSDQQRPHPLQHIETLAHQQQKHPLQHQMATPVLLQQQVSQQAQNATRQQLWHYQAQSEQQHQQMCTSQQDHHQPPHLHPQPQQHQQPSQQQHMHLQQPQPQHQPAAQQQQHSQQQELHQHHCSSNQQQPSNLERAQQNVQQHILQQDVPLKQPEELEQQKLQQSQNSLQVGIQPMQVSLEQPECQNLYLDDAGELHSSHKVAANGAVSAPQAANSVDDTALNSPMTASADGQRAQQYIKQQRWLMFLRHASKCTAPEGQCPSTPHCHTARQLWEHITKCTNNDCQYARCNASRTLVKHHQQCRDSQCPVCVPIKQRLQQRIQAAQGHALPGHSSSLGLATSASRTASFSGMTNAEASSNKRGVLAVGVTHVQPPPAKRAKVEQTEQIDIQLGFPVGCAKSQMSDFTPPQAEISLPTTRVPKIESHTFSVKIEGSGSLNAAMKSEVHGLSDADATVQRVTQVKSEISSQIKTDSGGREAQPLSHVKMEPTSVISHKVSIQGKQEAVTSASPFPGHDTISNTKSSKSKIKGVSLTELFTPEQIREHIFSLRQWVGQSKAKAEKNQAMEQRMSENSCQLCAVETLTFEPPPIYCATCGVRIKRNAPYWTMVTGETRHYFCIPCYNDARSDTVELDGLNYPKSKLEKRKNDEETEEPWVQCDKCEKWQHQVCALFNTRRNEGGQAEYTCPQCLIGEIEEGERKPLPQSSVLGAKDLPRTLLSDHIEQRLARRLKQERHDRARAQGKGFDEVPAADALVVRVVSSVDKKLDVKPHFLEIFQEEDYPTEFPYKSKALLLFQRIEGAEVCLFGMYVQEFGAECAQPNQRRIYLSYLDSVKYFRPDVRTATGEALRTFVYHEILIGYLDYCKRRGFTSCYIWACPPLKGEDYILYCHPEIQKTPKSDKLRDWYLAMLRKATGENIVAEVANLYDHFFVCTGEAKAKVTAARLPYFDGDYWPGAAEDMIMQLQEEEDGRRQPKKGKCKKTATKRATKAAAQAQLASNASKDLQLMHKLGESICPMKEDFIMVHLQYACTHCCSFIISGRFWVCKQCKDFRICERCYDAEQKLDEQDKHPVTSKEAHQLSPLEIADAMDDTEDKDEIMESEFFDTRQAFLSLCQGNHYQNDTLRRAKHSSMMVLYHLHNPTAPAFVTNCSTCHRDIETGQGWRCELCPEFDLCNSCYSKDDSIKHPHKLSPHPSAAEREGQNKEARQQRVLQLRKMLDLLVHASQCCSAQCQYPNCRRVKGLFRHGMNCKKRASGGCHLCKRMWYLLQLHARACKESECRVPRCKDLKEHLRRLQQQMESRRRAAVMEMMRQRAAEVAAGTC